MWRKYTEERDDLEMDLNIIRELCRSEKLQWTDHIFKRLLQRDISMSDVQTAILNGEIIEEYPDDYPYPSCLIIGCRSINHFIHVVCAPDQENDILWLITAYVPDKEKWSVDFKTRRG